MLTNIALFAFGNANPTQVFAYDDDATAALGNYAWAQWRGPSTYGWLPFTGGLSSAGGIDPPLLFSIYPGDGVQPQPVTLAQFGFNAGDTTIAMNASTGWVTCETPLLSKELHQIYLEVEASAALLAGQVQIQCTITPSIYNANANQAPSNYAPTVVTFPPTTQYAAGIEKYQMLKVTLEPFLRANAFSFDFATIPVTANGAAQVELSSMVLLYNEEAALP